MRKIYIGLLSIFACICQEVSAQPDEILKLLLEKQIIYRDSGQVVTREFLMSCLEAKSHIQYRLKCEDVLFTHHISYFTPTTNNSKIVLITQDGASVENRWVFEVKGNEYTDIKKHVWPVITSKTIGELLMAKTNNQKYTDHYIRRVAHSSYRVVHTMSSHLVVKSGIPDKSEGMELGIIEWNGREFKFLQNRS